MDATPTTLRDLAAMEAPTNPAPETPGTGSGRATCLEVSGKWSRPLVERRSVAHESGPATEVVRPSGSDLGTRYGKMA